MTTSRVLIGAGFLLVMGCLAASVIALGVTIWLADRQLFDKYGKLLA